MDADPTRPAEAGPAPRVLVVGTPRSGTSWVSQALAAARGAREVGEPDNEDNFPYAIRAKAGLGRFPVVPPGSPGPPAYAALWDGAFAGGRRVRGPGTALSRVLHRTARGHESVHAAAGWGGVRRAMLASSVALARPGGPAGGGPVVVKSVFVPLALRWVCDRWSPRLVLVLRGPLNTVSSWHRLGWDPPFAGHPVLGRPEVDRGVLAALLPGRDVPPAPPAEARVRRLTWELCVLVAALLDVRDEYGGAVVVRHEELCAGPERGFGELYGRLGLGWTERTAAYLRGSNTAGGGVYDTRRVAGDEPTRWRGRLSAAEAADVLATVAAFGVAW